MICAWDNLLRHLPQSMRQMVDRNGKEGLQELRLRSGRNLLLCKSTGVSELPLQVTNDDINYVINAATNYSPWNAQSLSQGFLTIAGGHRIGVCGDAVIKNGIISGFRSMSSLCIRVARDFPGIADQIPSDESILIIGPPGSGKTTLLRDLIRQISAKKSECVAVVDQRGELFPESSFTLGKNVDVISGCSKTEGIEILLRTMGPAWIAVDEITAAQDCQALILAGWCGVKLMATAHASNLQDLRNREVYRPLMETGLFRHFVVMDRRKSFHFERIPI